MSDPKDPKPKETDIDAKPKTVTTDLPAQTTELPGTEVGLEAGRKAARISEKKDVSSQISTLIRYIAFGLVAVTYSLFTSTAEFSIEMLEEHKNILLYASLAGGVTILLDYFQFVFGYYAVNKALGRDNKRYSKKWLSYKGRNFCFNAKQFTVAIGLILFCVAMLGSALPEETETPESTGTVPECEKSDDE